MGTLCLHVNTVEYGPHGAIPLELFKYAVTTEGAFDVGTRHALEPFNQMKLLVERAVELPVLLKAVSQSAALGDDLVRVRDQRHASLQPSFTMSDLESTSNGESDHDTSSEVDEVPRHMWFAPFAPDTIESLWHKMSESEFEYVIAQLDAFFTSIRSLSPELVSLVSVLETVYESAWSLWIEAYLDDILSHSGAPLACWDAFVETMIKSFGICGHSDHLVNLFVKYTTVIRALLQGSVTSDDVEFLLGAAGDSMDASDASSLAGLAKVILARDFKPDEADALKSRVSEIKMPEDISSLVLVCLAVAAQPVLEVEKSSEEEHVGSKRKRPNDDVESAE